MPIISEWMESHVCKWSQRESVYLLKCLHANPQKVVDYIRVRLNFRFLKTAPTGFIRTTNIRISVCFSVSGPNSLWCQPTFNSREEEQPPSVSQWQRYHLTSWLRTDGSVMSHRQEYSVYNVSLVWAPRLWDLMQLYFGDVWMKTSDFRSKFVVTHWLAVEQLLGP